MWDERVTGTWRKGTESLVRLTIFGLHFAESGRSVFAIALRSIETVPIQSELNLSVNLSELTEDLQIQARGYQKGDFLAAPALRASMGFIGAARLG